MNTSSVVSSSTRQMRTANSSDFDFILKHIVDGARSGHFDARLLGGDQLEMLRQDINAIIKTQRRATGSLGGHALIFMADTERVGMAIMTEMKDIPGMELYAIAVDDKARGHGYGSFMLNSLIEHYLPRGAVIYARCFPRSVVMYEMLINRGFEYVMTTRAGLRLVRLVHPAANIPPIP